MAAAHPPPECPTCGREMVPIVYGLPGPELFEQADRGKVILGGGVVRGGEWGCVACRPKRLSDDGRL